MVVAVDEWTKWHVYAHLAVEKGNKFLNILLLKVFLLIMRGWTGGGGTGIRRRNRGWRGRKPGWGRGGDRGGVESGMIVREIDFFIENSVKMAVLGI